MTTQPARDGSISQGWATIDAAGTAPSQSARLDIGRAWPGAERGREVRLALLDLKPGQSVLEVGPGTGLFAQEMAALVGGTGSVVGVDLSASMVAVAVERAANSGLPVTFQQGDVYHLEFPDGTFDACFATNVFLHLEDPLGALQEMVRVTRPGGRIVAGEQDTETNIFDAPDFEAGRAVTEAFMRNFRNPRVGRTLARLFREAGLTGVVVEAHTIFATNRALLWARSDWAGAVNRAIQEGKLSQERADAWLVSLDHASQEGHFFRAITLFNVAGRRP